MEEDILNQKERYSPVPRLSDTR